MPFIETTMHLTLHLLTTNVMVHMTMWIRKEKIVQGVAFVIPLWCLLMPFFTPAFPSDSRTFSPPSLFDVDLSIMTQSCWLLALLGHTGLIDFAMLVIHSDNALNSPPPHKQGTRGRAAKGKKGRQGIVIVSCL